MGLSENVRAISLAAIVAIVIAAFSAGTAELPTRFSLVDSECADAQQQYYLSREKLRSAQLPADKNGDTSEERNHADVCAQRLMAEAAHKGFWLLLLTWFFTGAAAVAAWMTLRTMRVTAERQLRGYLSISPTILINFDASYPIRIECQARNHGQTPIFEMNHVFEIAILPEPLPKGFVFPAPTRPINFNSSVFPQSEIKTWFNAIRPLTRAEVDSIDSGTHNLHFWGATTYRDAFGRSRRTTSQASFDLPTFIHHRSLLKTGQASANFNWCYGHRHNETT